MEFEQLGALIVIASRACGNESCAASAKSDRIGWVS